MPHEKGHRVGDCVLEDFVWESEKESHSIEKEGEDEQE